MPIATSDSVQHYEIAIESKKLSKTQQKKLEKALDLNLKVQEIALNFKLDDVESVRLDPHLDFKGKNHE